MKIVLFKIISISYWLGLLSLLSVSVHAQNGTRQVSVQSSQCSTLFSKPSFQSTESQKSKILKDFEDVQRLISSNQKRDLTFFTNLHSSLSQTVSILQSKEVIGFIVGKESYKIKNHYFQRQHEKENFYEHSLLSFNKNDLDARIRIPYFEFSVLFDLTQQLEQALKTNDLKKAESVYQILTKTSVLQNTRSSFYFFNNELGTVNKASDLKKSEDSK